MVIVIMNTKNKINSYVIDAICGDILEEPA